MSFLISGQFYQTDITTLSKSNPLSGSALAIFSYHR